MIAFTLFNDLMLIVFGEGDFLRERLTATGAFDFEVPLSVFGEGDGFDIFGAADKN